MALALAGNKGTDWKRGDMFYVDPAIIVVREDLRGRRYPPTGEDIARRAVSFFRYGQLQACEVRLTTEGTTKNVPVLNSGFTRCAAARLLREGFTVPEGFDEETTSGAVAMQVSPVKAGDFIQKEDFQLQIRHVKCNDEEALVRNIVENNERNDTSDVDDAHNQERLRRDCGFSNADVARLYGYGSGGQNKVSRFSRLLELPEAIQLRVHHREIPTQAAIDLLDSGRPKKEWEKLLEAATNDKGRVVATKLNDVVRDEHLADFGDGDELAAAAENGDHPALANPTATAPAADNPIRVKPRTTANLRKLVESVCGGEWDNIDPATVKLFQKIKVWLSGRCKDGTLLNAFDAHLEAEAAEEVESTEEDAKAA
jgi:ParB-like chromosome segregation protein Spo0J